MNKEIEDIIRQIRDMDNKEKRNHYCEALLELCEKLKDKSK